MELINACKNGDLELVKYLIETQGANPSIKVGEFSPLEIAAENNFIEMFKYINLFVNINYEKLKDILIICSKNGSIDIFKFLLNPDNFVNYIVRTSDMFEYQGHFIFLGKEGYIDMIEYIFELITPDNIDILKNKFLRIFHRILKTACEYNKIDVVKVINKNIREKNIEVDNNFYKGTVEACVMADNPYIIRELLFLADMNIKDEIYGNTPLLNSINRRKYKCAEILADYTDCNLQNIKGLNALMMILENNHFDFPQECFINILNKTDTEAKDINGNTALYHAIKNNFYEFTKIMLSCNKVDKYGLNYKKAHLYCNSKMKEVLKIYY